MTHYKAKISYYAIKVAQNYQTFVNYSLKALFKKSNAKNNESSNNNV